MEFLNEFSFIPVCQEGTRWANVPPGVHAAVQGWGHGPGCLWCPESSALFCSSAGPRVDFPVAFGKFAINRSLI